MKLIKIAFLIFLCELSFLASGQLSPGDLAKPHAHLEGMSNCTKCHTIGAKISNDKCLACHTEIKVRVDKKQGYHSSSKVYKKNCTVCHSDHHGRTYQIIHFDKSKFAHSETGYILEGKHATKQCADCHQLSNIVDPSLKKKKSSTYLGLGRECLACHEDYHQKTLNSECLTCHTYNSFAPAIKFDHSKSKFQLKGQHKEVECIKCHEKTVQNGKEFQKFHGIKFSGCASCHIDVHDNKFGQRCNDCHTEESFRIVKNNTGFNHDLTGFKLEGKHANVSCSSCHKRSLTVAVKHDFCNDCHIDFHKGEFSQNGKTRDCSDCHSVNGFSPSSFTVERHNATTFSLKGAHGNLPCHSCHKPQGEWKFKEIGNRCSQCHYDIHKDHLNPKFYPDQNCMSCHSLESWKEIAFNHNITNFVLEGKHADQSCTSCHKQKTSEVIFSGLSQSCMDCHSDIHQGQFDKDGKTECGRCHKFDNWIEVKFNHDNARFKLDGRHKNIDCIKCHPVAENNGKPYIVYKTGKTKCADCH